MDRPIMWVRRHWRGLLMSMVLIAAYGYARAMDLEYVCSQPGVVCE